MPSAEISWDEWKLVADPSGEDEATLDQCAAALDALGIPTTIHRCGGILDQHGQPQPPKLIISPVDLPSLEAKDGYTVVRFGGVVLPPMTAEQYTAWRGGM